MGIAILDIPITSSSIPTYIKEGDTIPKITITFDSGVDLTTSTIKMQVYDKEQKILDFTNDAGITVVSELIFEIDQIEKVNNNFREGIYMGDVEITDTNGIRTTYFNVRYTIIKQYTI